jgi:predicted esterase
MRSLTSALVAASLTLLAAASARADPAGEVIEGWPCKGCMTFTPTGGSAPRPLLIALHGDDGGTAKLFRALRPACEQERVHLVSLRCPTELGCRTSFWQWQITSGHDPGWLGAQIAAVKGRFAVDPARVYAAGYSGGATYLGWYGPTHPSDFAAIAHIAGGTPWGTRCPTCKVPVFFTLGASDPMLVPYTRPLRDYYEACGGHEIVWQTLLGVTHEGILGTVQAGKGREILTWLLAHRAACGDGAKDGGAGADPTHVEGGADPTHVGGAEDPTHVEGGADPTHVGGAAPTHVGPATAPTHVGPAADPTHVGPAADPTHVGPAADPTHVGPATAPTHVGPAADPTHVEPAAPLKLAPGASGCACALPPLASASASAPAPAAPAFALALLALFATRRSRRP